jgi:hypothetical protein
MCCTRNTTQQHASSLFFPVAMATQKMSFPPLLLLLLRLSTRLKINPKWKYSM